MSFAGSYIWMSFPLPVIFLANSAPGNMKVLVIVSDSPLRASVPVLRAIFSYGIYEPICTYAYLCRHIRCPAAVRVSLRSL